MTVLIQRIDEWIQHADAGWTDDDPQLDLEAYHPQHLLKRGRLSVVPVLVVDGWDEMAGHWFKAKRPRESGLMEMLPGSRPTPLVPRRSGKKHQNGKRRGPRTGSLLDGVAIDLGEMTRPLVSDDDLLDALGAYAGVTMALTEAGRTVLVVARYTRSGAQGFIGFWLEQQGGDLFRKCFWVVERGAAQHRRAGWHAQNIQDRTVSVIGAGSVGSYVADLLHRSGVLSLRVHDYDILLPGNLVRHAASPAFVGADKTVAVRDTVAERDATSLIETAPPVSTLDEAVVLLWERDLVIDCTGDRLTWQMMLAAAELSGVRFLHVAIEGHGQYGRVDVCPPLEGADPLPPNPVSAMELHEREGGCGDPVSPTPPTAVVETAAMGARIAIRMLAGEDVPPAGETRPLFPVAP